ncbi:nucleotide pyrophosphohydrolase [Halobacteriovorax sp.]|uniref:nucleotide pyrophosphohydrolase n=1 Tax=Halobacteriovorax sp. TaxID=2020862 RepID=UPI003562C2A2
MKEQVLDISLWQERLSDFSKARDWGQFHNPKNLSMALSVESSELVEIFQWLTLEQSSSLAPELKKKVENEMSDILMYLIRLSDVLDIDLSKSIDEKFILNGEKYPVELARGTAKKYNELKTE